MKFKVWDDKLKSWLSPEFYCLDGSGKLHYMYCGSIDHLTFYANECHDWIIPVFSTTTRDKNDNELFDGDIYHNGDPNILYLVIWDDAGFKGKQIGSSSYVGLDYWADVSVKVGNKFENPELLKR